MSQCNTCSAPLPSNNNRCNYCGTRNDVDLLGKYEFSNSRVSLNNICPHCTKPLKTIDLRINEPFQIERCETCFGLFFKPGEIEVLLNNAVANVFDINRELIKNINGNRFSTSQKVKYIKCPVCRQFMHRKNFGYRSGVIVDQCKQHGLWLDNGEITHLLEWKKAGGQQLHQRQHKQKSLNQKKYRTSTPCSFNDYNFKFKPDQDLLETTASVIFKFFN